jgi:hypothetical protein
MTSSTNSKQTSLTKQASDTKNEIYLEESRGPHGACASATVFVMLTDLPVVIASYQKVQRRIRTQCDSCTYRQIALIYNEN